MHHQRTLESPWFSPLSSASMAAGVNVPSRRDVAVTPPARVVIAALRVADKASCCTARCSGDTGGEYKPSRRRTNLF